MTHLSAKTDFERAWQDDSVPGGGPSPLGSPWKIRLAATRWQASKQEPNKTSVLTRQQARKPASGQACELQSHQACLLASQLPIIQEGHDGAGPGCSIRPRDPEGGHRRADDPACSPPIGKQASKPTCELASLRTGPQESPKATGLGRRPQLPAGEDATPRPAARRGRPTHSRPGTTQQNVMAGVVGRSVGGAAGGSCVSPLYL
jgi:hypothetical protein